MGHDARLFACHLRCSWDLRSCVDSEYGSRALASVCDMFVCGGAPGVDDQRGDTSGMIQSLSLRLAHSFSYKAGDMADVATGPIESGATSKHLKRLTTFPKGRKDA